MDMVYRRCSREIWLWGTAHWRDSIWSRFSRNIKSRCILSCLSYAVDREKPQRSIWINGKFIAGKAFHPHSMLRSSTLEGPRLQARKFVLREQLAAAHIFQNVVTREVNAEHRFFSFSISLNFVRRLLNLVSIKPRLCLWRARKAAIVTW